MKVLILYAKIGGGHLKAAEAIKEAFERNYKNVNVVLNDGMEALKTRSLSNKVLIKSYLSITKYTPDIWRNIYNMSDKMDNSALKELYDLNVELKNNNINNPLPLFISIDEEGKSVSRLPEDANKIPDAVDFGSIDDIKLTEKAGAIIGEELYAMGINMNFAPVLDIPVLKNNTLLKRRAYGKEPSIVSRHGIAFINGLSSQNIISVAKHFPGHGGSNMDSHKTLPLLDAEYSLIKNRELIPFKNAIKEGIDAVMLGHLAFPKIDDSGLPASRSKVFITEILRESLGFEGITVTDDIEMYGFLGNNKNIDELIVEAFNSGIDIFLISHTKKLQKDVLDALYDGVKKGHITKERLDESLKRIIKIKLKYFLSNEMNMDFDKAYGILTDKNNKSLFENIK